MLKVRHCGGHCAACRRMHLEEKYFALFFLTTRALHVIMSTLTNFIDSNEN